MKRWYFLTWTGAAYGPYLANDLVGAREALAKAMVWPSFAAFCEACEVDDPDGLNNPEDWVWVGIKVTDLLAA